MPCSKLKIFVFPCYKSCFSKCDPKLAIRFHVWVYVFLSSFARTRIIKICCWRPCLFQPIQKVLKKRFLLGCILSHEFGILGKHNQRGLWIHSPERALRHARTRYRQTNGIPFVSTWKPERSSTCRIDSPCATLVWHWTVEMPMTLTHLGGRQGKKSTKSERRRHI